MSVGRSHVPVPILGGENPGPVITVISRHTDEKEGRHIVGMSCQTVGIVVYIYLVVAVEIDHAQTV